MTSYIENAMKMQGQVTINQPSDSRFVCAKMTWPNIEGQVSAVGVDLTEAMDKLDDALRDDWASETGDSGH